MVHRILDLSWRYRISFFTARSSFLKFLKVINLELDNIRFTTTTADRECEADKFRLLRNSPLCGVIGELDGTEVAIQAPVAPEVGNPKKI